MPVIGHDPVACRRRNRLAARQGRNAVPVKLLAQAPPPIDTNNPATEKGLRIITASGTLPRTPAAAMRRINAMRGDDQPALTAEQVHIVYLEAGNSNFIRKYFMFLSDSSLRNIARRGNRSIAFMNSHRTGGLSTPAELPYGRTFAGRFEKAITADDRPFSRTLLGVYMLRGQRPNGANGPSTDELYEGIKAGTIFDVSLGIQGGDEICDVCGYAVDELDAESRELLCLHIPGTHYRMTEEEIDTQLARGVPDGLASFTLQDATAGEVSPVYDGAVPGAGFRKALRAARARNLSASDLEEARRSFGPLAGRRDFTLTPRGPVMPPTRKKVSTNALLRIAEQLGIDLEDDDEGQAPVAPATATVTTTAAPPAPTSTATTQSATEPAPQLSADVEGRFRQLEEQNRQLAATLESERKQREDDGRKQRRATVLAQAANWADQQIRLSAAIPAERQGLISLHAQAAMDDHETPAQVAFVDATATPKLGSRVEALEATWAKRGRHDFTTEHVAPASNNGAPAAANGSAPLVDLSAFSPAGSPQSDPLTERMVSAAASYQNARNGRSGNSAN